MARERWDEAAPEEYGMDSAALEALRAYAFRPAHNTQAVLVVKEGVLVGEWYAEGRDETSLVTTWSIGKSVMSSLVGSDGRWIARWMTPHQDHPFSGQMDQMRISPYDISSKCALSPGKHDSIRMASTVPSRASCSTPSIAHLFGNLYAV